MYTVVEMNMFVFLQWTHLSCYNEHNLFSYDDYNCLVTVNIIIINDEHGCLITINQLSHFDDYCQHVTVVVMMIIRFSHNNKYDYLITINTIILLRWKQLSSYDG